MQQLVESSALSRMLGQVERFQREVIGQPIPRRPRPIRDERKQYCVAHLQEELNEFISARTTKDQADAMVDLAYVALGRLVEMGVLPGPAFDAVHEKNMTKKRGKLDKRPHSQGLDAIKPEGFRDVDWNRLLSFRMKDMEELPVRKPKIMVMGYARHGKDTVCEFLRDDFGYSFQSSSRFCAERVVYPVLADQYSNAEECYEDRSNRRKAWYELIAEYNAKDPTRLGRALLSEFDIYCGVRSSREFHALRNARVFDFSIWVDASFRHPPEDSSSCTIAPWMADYVLDNNGTLEDLQRGVDSLMSILEGRFYDAAGVR